LRLIEDDYGTLRKWEGRSSLKTYLTVVLTREYSNYRNMQWGRWRPSAAAQRLGPVAIRLEQLIVRDGCTLREALAILRSAGVKETDAELRQMAAQLPLRWDVRELLNDDDVHDIADPTAKGPIDHEARERVLAALRSAIEAMPQDDRVLVRMYYWDNISVANIARILGVEQKPLYPRLKSIHRRLMEALRRAGISDEDIRDMLRDIDE
jgi:RNA polymerase sigma factor for flagellar operon FliA